MPGRKYSEATTNEAAELREQGLSYGQISKRLNMTESAVYWHCLRLGADSPKFRPKEDHKIGPMVVNRGNHTVRGFTPDEDKILLNMSKAGAGIMEISRAMNRKHNSVKGRLMTLARHEAREEAQ